MSLIVNTLQKTPKESDFLSDKAQICGAKVSKVWEYFEEDEAAELVRCQLCRHSREALRHHLFVCAGGVTARSCVY